ncbi:MAG: hypothetical protein MAG451_00927 [Anaerolineales bacterium]|nr:hypothetical protein [Anaerolineales bacterium]
MADEVQDMDWLFTQPILQSRHRRVGQEVDLQKTIADELAQCQANPVRLTRNIQRSIVGWAGNHDQEMQRRCELQRRHWRFQLDIPDNRCAS